MKSPRSNVAFATFVVWHVLPSLVRKIDVKPVVMMMTDWASLKQFLFF